jgi:uncharacterized cupredoxin-like copper-binding protein
MTRNARIGVLLGGIVVIVAAFVIISSTSGDDSAPDNASASITVANGRPDGGLKHITVEKGGTINLAVTSNIADEVHVHGYDVEKEVKAGGTVRFHIKANMDGVFEVEVHKPTANQIAELEVKP